MMKQKLSYLLVLFLFQYGFSCSGGDPNEDHNLDGQLTMSVEQVMVGFEKAYKSLYKQLQNDDTIPIINHSMKDLSKVKEQFDTAMEKYSQHQAYELDDLESHLAEAFGSTGYLRDRIRVDIGNIYTGSKTWKQGLVIALFDLKHVEEMTLSMDFPLWDGDTLTLGSMDISSFISWNMQVGFVPEGDTLATYINRDGTFFRGAFFKKLDSIKYPGALGHHDVEVTIDSSKAPLLMCNSGSNFEFDYYNESAWYPLSDTVPGLKYYAESMGSSGEMMFASGGKEYLLRLGLTDKSGKVVFDRRKQQFHKEAKTVQLLTIESDKLENDVAALPPFHWVVVVGERN